MERIYILYGCGTEYISASKLKARYEMNLSNNGTNGWAGQYKSFEDFISKGIANGTIV